METTGRVSLWLGRAESRVAFERSIEASFSGDGDFLGSPISRGFGSGYYEDALREAEFRRVPPRTLHGFLAGSRYFEITETRFEGLGVQLAPDDNCFVLLYDYDYLGSKKRWQGDGVSVNFVGSVSYIP